MTTQTAPTPLRLPDDDETLASIACAVLDLPRGQAIGKGLHAKLETGAPPITFADVRELRDDLLALRGRIETIVERIDAVRETGAALERLYGRFPYIVAWGERLHSLQYYIDGEVQGASDDNAPETALYKREDGSWATIDDKGMDIDLRVALRTRATRIRALADPGAIAG